MKNINFKKDILPHILAVAFFLVLSFVYFSPLLEGKVIKQQDITQWKGMSKEAMDYNKTHDKPTFWTNSMFGGMPTYMITGGYEYNMYIIGNFKEVILKWIPKPANVLFLCLISFYFLLIAFGINIPLSIIGAIAFGFSSNNLISVEAGHMTKIMATGFAPFVLMGLVIAYRRKKIIIGAALTAVFLSYEIAVNHLQITYYLLILILIYIVAEFISYYKKGAIKAFLKTSVFVLVGALLAVGANFTKLALADEYSHESTRGPSELKKPNEEQSSGLDKEYALRWSYGIAETGTLFIPDFVGGSSMKFFVSDPNSKSLRALRSLGNQKKAQQLANSTSHYWGDQPFTSGPIYFGSIICFLFVLGIFLVPKRQKWWLIIASVLSIMLAWGKHFPILTNLFFDYFPLYNKFRTVTMILFIAQVTFPVLGILALDQIIKSNPSKEDLFKALKYATGIVGGLALIFALVPGMFFDFMGESSKNLAQQAPNLYEALQADRKALLRADAFRSLIFIILAAGAIFLYLRQIIKNLNIVLIAVGALVLIDLWAVDKRYLNDESFERQRRNQKDIPMTEADRAILQDKDPDYRVLNLTVSPFNDATTSYYHKSVGGYHGAKLGRYQELIEYELSDEFQQIVNQNFDKTPALNMLNTRYIIGGKSARAVLRNPKALGNAWFVKNLKEVETANDEVEGIGDINPGVTALYNKKYADYLDNFNLNFDPNATIKLTHYEPNKLEYQSKASSPQFAVFSEIYYDEGLGWKAYIDGKEARHIRINYVLRGMIIPAGEHQITFKFDPPTYHKAEKVSLASSLLLLLVLLGSLSYEFYFKDKMGKGG